MLYALFTAVMLGLLDVDPKRTARRIVWGQRIILPSVALIFALDLLAPLGVALPALYAVPVFLGSLLFSLERSFALTVGVTVLTFAGYLYSPPGGDHWVGDVNRIIATLLVWSTLFAGWFLASIRRQIKGFYDEHHQD